MKETSEVNLLSYAKINLYLRVVGKTGNLHELDMVNSAISLADEIRVRFLETDELKVTFSDKSIDSETSTVMRAMKLVREIVPFGAEVFVEKRIPSEAGLGGGSGNASTILKFLDEELGLRERGVDVREVGLKVGSDVPCMMDFGFSRASGVSASVQKIESDLKVWLVLVKGERGVSTGKCFSECRIQNSEFRIIDDLIGAIRNNDLGGVVRNLRNDLFEPAVSFVSEIRDHIELLKTHGALTAFMTGSGSCCVGIFKDEESARIAEEGLRREGARLWTAVARTK